MKKEIIGVVVVLILGVGAVVGLGVTGMILDQRQIETEKEVSLEDLPKPELSGGMRGEMGIDKNINEASLDRYLGRDDVVYRDVRMLVDEAVYENIGGDSYLSGYVEGFEVVPAPLLVNLSGLPEAVGATYSGKTLFTEENGQYRPNYEESMEILEYYFPKDKKIFLMCGGGGYAGMIKNLLVELEWKADDIYNVGGFWYYDGEHGVQIKHVEDGVAKYDFWKVPYHDIWFEYLTEM